MLRGMEWLNEFTPEQWAIIGVVAAVATALATGLSAGLAMLWRVADRKRTVWVTHGAQSSWKKADRYSSVDEVPSAEAELANVGDGAALAVRVVGLGCGVAIQGERVASQVGPSSWRPEYELVAAMRPGDEKHLRILCEPTEWHTASVAVIWTTRPAWIRKRRIELLPLPSIAPRPRYLHEELDPDLPGRETRKEAPEPPPPVLPEGLRPARTPVPSRWEWLQRRRVMQELKRL